MSEIPWKPGETYRTRDGRGARVYAVDGGEDYPIHGAINGRAGWTAIEWSNDGSAAPEGLYPQDLMPPKLVFWINRYPSHLLGPYDSREAADWAAGICRTECIRVEYEPGQFDE